MQRQPLMAVLVLLVLGAGVVFWWFSGAPAAPPPVERTDIDAAIPTAAHAAEQGESTETLAREAGSRREVAPFAGEDVLDDPEIRAALTGFRGRVVDHAHQPVAGCGVRIYRGALDSVLPAGLDFFADEPTLVPDYVAGEAETGEDGTFVIGGVWPRAFYLLLAGIGTDAPSHVLIQQSPEPGQLLDLGDIVLDHTAVAVGTVVDDDGEPVEGALVRAVDLPGQLLALMPVERFDPRGCLIIRERQSPVPVVEMPDWVARAFEHLPIPATRTGADGRFRLPGIAPGNNVVATTSRGLVPDVKPVVRFEAGQEKDLGRIRLREGEELSVRVVDTAGRPVVGAEVVAGNTTLAAPVDFASRIGTTDDDGRVAALGFGAGKASVAARRTERDPWVSAEPQPVLTDVIVTLPAAAELVVQVTLEGRPVEDPELRLLPGRRREEALVMSVLGVERALDLDGRTERREEDGAIVLTDIPHGRYVLLAKTEGAAVGVAEVDVGVGPQAVQVDLEPAAEYVVVALGPDEKPVRNAAVFVQGRGGQQLAPMPLRAGCTGGDGRLHVTSVQAEEIRVTVDHPRYGAVHGETKLGAGELVLRFQEPGWIEGVLTDSGQPVPAGKYTLVAEHRRNGGPREAVDQVPALATCGQDGVFAMRALQPGQYRIEVIPSLALIRSPGGLMNTMQNMFRSNELPKEMVEVLAGQGTEIALDVAKELFDGPVGAVFGSVVVDGRLAEGYTVQSWSPKGRRATTVDAAGRFDIGDVPAGPVQLTLIGNDGSLFGRQNMWSTSFQLAEAERREVVVELLTTAIRGVVRMPDGTPGAGLNVRARGRPLDGKDGDDNVWRWEIAGADGRFAFDKVPAGIYELSAEAEGEAGVRVKLPGVRAEGGRPVLDLQLQLAQAIVVRGRIDTSAMGGEPGWIWIGFHKPDPEHPDDRDRASRVDGCSVEDDRSFETYDLDPGTYFVRVHAQVGEEWRQFRVDEPLVVSATGVADIVLRPLPQ